MLLNNGQALNIAASIFILCRNNNFIVFYLYETQYKSTRLNCCKFTIAGSNIFLNSKELLVEIHLFKYED